MSELDEGLIDEPQGGQEGGDATDWKAEARKWEKRAKENSKAAEKLKELEDAQKSELEKAQERADKAEAALKDAEKRANLEKLTAKVAKEKGVPAELLVGNDEAELSDYADKLIKAFKPEPAPKVDKPGAFDTSTSDGNESMREAARMLFGND